MNNQQLINSGISKRDALMAEIRDKIPLGELKRISDGDCRRKDIPVIRRLAAIAYIDLFIADLELIETCK